MTNKHYFTKQETIELLSNCVGKTLKEIDKNNVFDLVRTGKLNKGIAGAIIEQSVFNYPADTKQEPDLIIDGVETELKSTGIRKKGNSYVAKEPMSITAVSINKIIYEDDFEQSNFWHKLAHLLFVFYLYDSNVAVSSIEYERFPIKGFEFYEFNEEEKETLFNDWLLVRDYIRHCFECEDKEKQLSLLGTNLRKHLMFIDTAPRYPHPPRFRLKKTVVSNIVEDYFSSGTEENVSFSKFKELDDKLDVLTSLYSGKTIRELLIKFDLLKEKINKSIGETIVCRMFVSKAKKINSIKLFNKVGVIGKTINLSINNGRTEDMKLFNIDFDEIQNEDISFEESSFREYFSSHQFLCIIFKETEERNANLLNNTFVGFKRIYFTEEFIDTEVKRVWDEIRRLIFTNALVDEITYDAKGNPRRNPCGNIMSAPNFPKSSEGNIFVRGSSSDSNYKPLKINGINMYLQYIWIKGSYIVNMLKDNKDL